MGRPMSVPLKPNPLRLVYSGQLPRMNRNAPHWIYGYRLKQTALRQFGTWPVAETRPATVIVTRVLGLHQRLMDADDLAWTLKKLVDALPNRHQRRNGIYGGGNYLVDDGPPWAMVTYTQDATRRHEGPRVEVEITYETREGD